MKGACLKPFISSPHLQLVQDLEMHGIQVLYRHILQDVLQRVKHPGYNQLPPIRRKHGIVYLLKQHRRRRAGRQRLGCFVQGQRKGNSQLDDLVEEDGGRGKVSMVACWRHDAREVHYENKGRVLDRQL